MRDSKLRNTTIAPMNKGQILACHKAAKKAHFYQWNNIQYVTVGKMKVAFGIAPNWSKYFCVKFD